MFYVTQVPTTVPVTPKQLPSFSKSASVRKKITKEIAQEAIAFDINEFKEFYVTVKHTFDYKADNSTQDLDINTLVVINGVASGKDAEGKYKITDQEGTVWICWDRAFRTKKQAIEFVTQENEKLINEVTDDFNKKRALHKRSELRKINQRVKNFTPSKSDINAAIEEALGLHDTCIMDYRAAHMPIFAASDLQNYYVNIIDREVKLFARKYETVYKREIEVPRKRWFRKPKLVKFNREAVLVSRNVEVDQKTLAAL